MRGGSGCAINGSLWIARSVVDFPVICVIIEYHTAKNAKEAGSAGESIRLSPEEPTRGSGELQFL